MATFKIQNAAGTKLTLNCIVFLNQNIDESKVSYYVSVSPPFSSDITNQPQLLGCFPCHPSVHKSNDKYIFSTACAPVSRASLIFSRPKTQNRQQLVHAFGAKPPTSSELFMHTLLHPNSTCWALQN